MRLKFAKKGSSQTTASEAEAIEVALAHGWVDGQLDKFDDQFWLVRFTRRGPRSRWSQVNRDIASRLLAEGRLAPAGRPAVEAAQRDGRWDAAYAPQSRAEAPHDLQEVHIASLAKQRPDSFTISRSAFRRASALRGRLATIDPGFIRQRPGNAFCGSAAVYFTQRCSTVLCTSRSRAA